MKKYIVFLILITFLVGCSGNVRNNTSTARKDRQDVSYSTYQWNQNRYSSPQKTCRRGAGRSAFGAITFLANALAGSQRGMREGAKNMANGRMECK